MSRVTEVKFAVGKVSKPTVIAGLGVGTDAPFAYEATYFDTDDLDLRRHQVELRLQHTDGQSVQAIKSRAHESNTFAFQVHELAISDCQPNIDHARSLLPRSVRDAISLSALKPLFRISSRRVVHHLANRFYKAEVSFDEGFIEAADRRRRFSEVEFELKGGAFDSYSKECLAVLDQVPASILIDSKAERGYRLALGELPQPVFAHSTLLAGQVPLPDAILRIFRTSLAHLLHNHPSVTLSGRPESIHQMRIGVRRLRSAIRMFRPVLCLEGARDVLEDLRGLFARLGEVRDADVFLSETLPVVAKAGLGDRLKSVLRQEVAAFRKATYREVRDELTSPDFARLVVQLNDWIEGRRWLKADQPIDALLTERAAEEFVAPRITKLYLKLLKCGFKARHGTLDDWHRTRIAAKKLRYGGEPLIAALMPTIDSGNFSKRLSRLQTSLGHLNDLQTITPFLSRVRSHVQGSNQRDFEAADYFCRGWSGAATASFVREAETAMERFEKDL
jgi:triphosphatase